MPRSVIKSLAALAGVFFAVWLALRWLLPLLLPFLLGSALAMAAEPLVGLLSRRLPRGLSAGIGVALTLGLLACILVLLLATALRQLGALAGALPDLEQTATQGLSALESFLTNLAQRLPTGVQPLVMQLVSGLFSGGNALVDRLAVKLPGMATTLFSHVPGSALTVGTGILSGFMVSARLPQLRLRLRPLREKLQKYLPMAQRLKQSLWGWMKAQFTLSGVCFLLVCTGLLILGVAYAPVWAVAIALVDAIPVLGTGTVLLPWALVGLLQGNHVLSLGLVGIYLCAMLSRTVLEPRLVGKQLGIDPLMTLMALYVGYRIWGFGGMLLSPMLCAAATELTHFSH